MLSMDLVLMGCKTISEYAAFILTTNGAAIEVTTIPHQPPSLQLYGRVLEMSWQSFS